MHTGASSDSPAFKTVGSDRNRRMNYHSLPLWKGSSCKVTEQSALAWGNAPGPLEDALDLLILGPSDVTTV